MINITNDECKKIKLFPILYSEAEAEIRETNRNMLLALMEIEQDEDCVNTLNSKTSDSELPYKLVKFYNMYSDVSIESNEKAIIKFINKERDSFNTKVANFSEKWGYEKEFIKNSAKNNPLFLLEFAKEPSKQTFHQHYAARYIAKLPLVEEFKELASGGQNALYIVSGQVIEGKDKRYLKTGKSIDFQWEYTFKDKKIKFYATHKYTKSCGGSQDNQYKDVQEFQHEARSSIDPNVYFFSITDGPYYLSKNTNIKGLEMTKIEYLKKQYVGNRNNATTTDDLLKDMIPVVKEWLTDNFQSVDVKDELDKLDIIMESIDK